MKDNYNLVFSLSKTTEINKVSNKQRIFYDNFLKLVDL